MCVCVCCVVPQHVASISVLCCVPPLFYPSQRLVTIEDVFMVKNKSVLTGFLIQSVFLMFLQQKKQILCNIVLLEKIVQVKMYPCVFVCVCVPLWCVD